MSYNAEKVKEIANKMLSDAGIGPREASRLTDIHRATIYNILAGDKVSAETLRKFATGLNHSPISLLEAGGYETDLPADPVQRVQYALNGIPFLEEYQVERIKELVEKHMKKDKDE